MSYIIKFLCLLEYQEIAMSIEKSLNKEKTKEKRREEKRKEKRKKERKEKSTMSGKRKSED